MTIIAVILVLGGVLGSSWGPSWLIVLSGLGLFGPYLLREAGVLSWRDDFQRETTLRAGMHALIVTGILLVVVQGAFRVLAILAGAMTVLVTASFIHSAIQGHPMGFHGIWTGYAQLAWLGCLAFTARRWPRLTSLALTGTVALAIWTVFRGWNQGWSLDMSIMVLNLVVVPLMVPAIALFTHREIIEEELS